MFARLQVLKRINSEIEARRKAGENLPPPPKTAIAGPEYFGLNQPEASLWGAAVPGPASFATAHKPANELAYTGLLDRAGHHCTVYESSSLVG